MARKTWIKLKRGILDPKHREAIGIRIWLYLYILDKANWEEGAVITWRDQDAAEELEMPIYTIREQRRQLEASGYVKTEHRSDHLRLTVSKWVNPREYSGQVYNPPHVAVPDEPKSGESSPLSTEGGGGQSGDQGGGQSGDQGGQSSPPSYKESQVTGHRTQDTRRNSSVSPSPISPDAGKISLSPEDLWDKAIRSLKTSLPAHIFRLLDHSQGRAIVDDQIPVLEVDVPEPNPMPTALLNGADYVVWLNDRVSLYAGHAVSGVVAVSVEVLFHRADP